VGSRLSGRHASFPPKGEEKEKGEAAQRHARSAYLIESGGVKHGFRVLAGVGLLFVIAFLAAGLACDHRRSGLLAVAGGALYIAAGVTMPPRRRPRGLRTATIVGGALIAAAGIAVAWS
jgi:hypothetical protein